MPVPYHTHTFEIPTATKQEVAAGVISDKVVVPNALGSAATSNVDDYATAGQGVKADNAVPNTRKIEVGEGLIGGGALSGDVNIALSQTSIQSLAKADGAFPAVDAGDLAKKSKVGIDDLSATGAKSADTFLRGDGVWAAPDTSAADMRKTVYDPNNIAKDIFNADNIKQGSTNLFLTASERVALARVLSSLDSFIGLTSYFSATSAPDDWLVADGSLFDRASYPKLWAFAQARGVLKSDADWSNGFQGCYSTGDGSTTFRIPDLRGEFLRSLDKGRGVDANRAIGSRQADELKSHYHTHELRYGNGPSSGFAAPWSNTATTYGFPTNSTGGNETRPRNIALLACIRWR